MIMLSNNDINMQNYAIINAHQIPPNLHFASPRVKQIKSKTKKRNLKKQNKEK